MDEFKFKTYHLKSMGMPFTLKFVLNPTSSATILDETANRIQTYLDHVDQDFSPFKNNSLVTKYQQRELTIDQFTAEFQEVYGLALKAQEITKGAFDPFYYQTYNPTGLVKGWAIQRGFENYLQPLINAGIVQAAALNGAGDIQMGVSEDSNFKWEIGIENPVNLQDALYQFAITNGAIATSGFSKRGQHIKLQDGAGQLIQSTMVADELIEADILATAVIAMGKPKLHEFDYPMAGIVIDQANQIMTLEKK